VKKVPASVQLLDTRLKAADPEIRRQAYVKIPQLDAPGESIVDKAMELIDHENWYVRQAGCKAISHCTDAGFAIIAAKIVQSRLADEDPDVRRRVNDALVDLVERATTVCPDSTGAEDAVKLAATSMSERLTHSDPRTRQNAVNALSKIGAQATPHAEALCNLVVDPDLSVRNEVVRMVDRLGAVIVEGASTLAQGLGHEQEPIRRSAKRAILALSKVCGKEAAKATCEMLQNESAITRVATLDCLAELTSFTGPHVAQIAELLEDKRQEVRASAVRAIVSAGPAAQPGKKELPGMKALRSRIKHQNLDTRRAAVQALRGLASVCLAVANRAAKDLQDGEDTRMQSIEVLGGAAQNVTPYLGEIVGSLEDSDWLIRRVTIEALHDLQEHAKPIVPELCRRLVHQDAFVRKSAAEAVGRMGVHAICHGHRVEALLATEEDQDVRQTCAEACENLYAAGMAHG
jgi:HEAT repeat protein